MSVDLGGLELDSEQRRRGVDGADPWPVAHGGGRGRSSVPWGPPGALDLL